MLVSHLKKVTEIDNRIVAMHRELAELYNQRHMLIDGQDGLTTASQSSYKTSFTSASTASLSSSEQLYRQVAAAWERYGIMVPAFSKLKARLQKAERIRTSIHESYPEIAEHLRIVAVPPSSIMTLPAADSLRKLQPNNELPDFMSPGIKVPKLPEAWELQLVYCAPNSLYIGSAKKARESKVYMIAGYDMRALGVREYTALTLQVNYLIDDTTSTILLKNHRRNMPVPYASYRHGRYRFELEDDDNVLDDDGFRPAIEL